MNQDSRDAPQLRSYMYGEGDLGSLAIFSGGFINYGYWPAELDTSRPLTEAQRTDSQAALYRQTVDRLGDNASGRLLEIGCGKGAGAALVAGHTGASGLIGLDLSAQQLARAAAAVSHPALRFVRGSATRLPMSDASLDGVYSVEAAQHVDDHAALASEAHRVLRPGGRVAIAGFFAPGETSEVRLGELLETVGNGIDVVAPVGGFARRLSDAGFGDVVTEAIGERVWRGLDAWIAQTEFHDSWGRNWWHAYRQGWVDYYLVHATRPEAGGA